ncbi:unnamed protein product [Acanthoscelides obtectus]|uniref:Tc1-like transposase DDE domain-containing protein n=1 Tax=Acanthoscelides obtectus TaxID=200917 RepID=A0A9P0K7D2_ACAOB|nr:unnamed protein product [Acanthoscelides obtectus]CAK1658181.1 Histone-lysine N-methyltransferase SETMAR [Acanthoscelides obtectus]
MFSHEEKCDMLECYLVELYPARIQPYERYFLRLYRKFRGNENVFAKTRAKKEFIISEATEIAVIGYFEAYRENSIADILKDSNFSYGTVQRILKKYKFIPYKYRPVQTLLAGDPERRLVFCHWYLSFCRQNVNNFRYLLWTDESNFSNSGMFNRKNHHYWSRENLLLVHPRGPQVRFSFNVWCGIIGSKIVGPFFYEGTLTGERYVEFMSEILTNFLDELDLISRHHLHFQQDGAPAHNSRGTYHFLSTTFNDQWIGTNGPIQWPPRSPDLNPLDYFLWGYLKNQIYKRRYDNLDALKTAVREKITQIDGRTILKTVRAVEKRAQKCIEEQAPHQPTISRWYGEFKRGRVSFSDDPRVGAPKTAVTQESDDAVRKLIIEDRHVTYREIEASLKISKTSNQKILHEELGIKKLVSRWIPHLLTEEQKAARVNWCQKTLDHFNSGNSKNSAVWVFQVFRSRSVSKKMVATFVSKAGHIATIPLNEQRTVAADWYTTICLPKVITELRKINPERRIVLHQDNASSHTAQKTRQYLTEENVELLDHPPYSPDLSPNDFFTFPKIKNRLRGQRFQSPEEAVDAFKNAVLDLLGNEWNKCFENWFERMQMCINLRGEYFEKQ